MKRRLWTLGVCLCACLPAIAQTAATPSLSGTWQIEYHDNNGKEVDTPVVSFLQSAGRLEGVFGNKHWPVAGTVSGKEVKFWFSPPQHREVTVRYQGNLDNPNRISGTMASEVQSGTFVAVRKQ